MIAAGRKDPRFAAFCWSASIFAKRASYKQNRVYKSFIKVKVLFFFFISIFMKLEALASTSVFVKWSINTHGTANPSLFLNKLQDSDSKALFLECMCGCVIATLLSSLERFKTYTLFICLKEFLGLLPYYSGKIPTRTCLILRSLLYQPSQVEGLKFHESLTH